MGNKAFSGGQQTVEEHRAKGANLEIDSPFQYLKFHLKSDEELKHIAEEYSSGRMLSGPVKKRCIEVYTEIVQKFQEARSKVTDEMVDEFMSIRKLELPGYSGLAT